MSVGRGAIAQMLTLLRDRTPVPGPTPIALDSDQARVVAHRDGALRVLAGPGTGKTTTLVQAMIARLTGDDALHPDQVLGLTFGRRAALQWRDKVTAAVGGGLVPTVSTFHSFCYSLLRMFAADDAYQVALRLLSGPEQQARARALLQEAVAEGRVVWPDDLEQAVGTQGLVEEIRAVMSRTRSFAMEPADLVALGKREGMPLWTVVGQFMGEYIEVLDFEGALDYSELIFRTLLLCERNDVQAHLHRTVRAVFVDEYQDTDPGQIELLRRMLTSDTSLVVVGDFDQAIYGFRGADEAAIREFREKFGDIYGDRIDDVVLRNCRRFGTNVRAVADVAISDYRPAAVGQPLLDAHRSPDCSTAEPGDVQVMTFDTDSAQAAHIADVIAREHAIGGRPWSDMAGIVRSASVSVAPLYRALVAAGVPVEVATDEIPIHQDPAVAPLLSLLRVIENARALTPEVAMDLLTGPIGSVDPMDLRRFERVLRESDRGNGRVARSSGVLVAEVLGNIALLDAIDTTRISDVAESVRRLGKTIEAARAQVKAGESPHAVLWTVWQSSSWPARLRERALGVGTTSQRAHRDLDAICALFDNAARFVTRSGALGLRVFLEELMSQQIPGETLAENDLRGDVVRILTAHRAKGLEWPFVVVAALQEGLWPNLIVPGTLLQPERIGDRHKLMPLTTKEMLDAERRLFFVAATRAQECLILTACHEHDAASETGARMSRFLRDVLDSAGYSETPTSERSEVEASAPQLTWSHHLGRPRAGLSADAVVARLRRALRDSDEQVRAAAARRLVALAQSGKSAFRGANPETWWGSRDLTSNAVHPSADLHLSASTINAIETCAARWYLEKKIHAELPSGMAPVFGNLLHKVAEGLAQGHISPTPEAVASKVDLAWAGMDYAIAWEDSYQHEQAKLAASRLLNWFLAHQDQHSVVESKLDCTVAVPREDGSSISVHITGRADRIEFTADGVVVYDFKTSSKTENLKDLVSSVQLALYELLVTTGTYTDTEGHQQRVEDAQVDHTALVQLRFGDDTDPGLPLVQTVAAGAHDASGTEGSLLDRISDAVSVILDEKYETNPTYECKWCPVRFLCPAQTEGGQVL